MGIRMGASGNPALYRGTIDALVRIAREEGVVGLYRWAQALTGWVGCRAALPHRRYWRARRLFNAGLTVVSGPSPSRTWKRGRNIAWTLDCCPCSGPVQLIASHF